MLVTAITNALYTFWNQIVFALSNFRIFDIIDIVVVAWIIYMAIGFLRETRAGQLVKGLVVLLVVYLFAEWFELAVLRWILTAIVNSAIIALAVIFQPELRRALEKVGQVRLGTNRMLDNEQEQISRCIDSVCKAAGKMQETKTGALIVFERKTQLGEVINTGTVVDAETSVEMVSNIFFPKSPLHDGGMIIREGRIYAAGCILPLTPNNSIASELGTRHRAAIGMTENSDAVVLVVSEETGIISIAKNGAITRNFSAASAGAALKEILISEDADERDFKLIATIKSLIPFISKNENPEESEVGGNEN